MKNLSALLLCVVCACGGSQTAAKEETLPARVGSPTSVAKVDFPLAEQARAGVEDEELAALLVAHWDWKMQNSPVWASTLGDHRFEDRLADRSLAAVLAAREKRREFLQSARAIDASVLGEEDRTTRALFIDSLERRIATEVCQSHTWAVSARDNPVVSANVLPEDHKLTDSTSAEALLSRYRQIPASVDQSIESLRVGLKAGRVANAESLRRTAALVGGQLNTPIEKWALLEPLSAQPLASFPAPKRRAFRQKLRKLVENDIRKAFSRYLEFLEGELIPHGRVGGEIGVHALSDGKSCYGARIRNFTSLQQSADDIHQLGLREIERINAEMVDLGRKLFGTKTLAKTVSYLRTEDSLYFEDKEEILAKARKALAKAKAAIPEHFGLLPKTDCKVVEIPEYEAPYTTIAYYRGPHPGSEKPGEYFINTYKPEVRPRFEMEVLAYHESIPGHHLQIAIAQERGSLPAFRRFGGSTAFVEGWALYTERLAEEMGLYSADLDRMGMLSYDAWRAARLVVDTGIHAKGWTREQAEDFMAKHTALTEENIRNEVDRYISWPGQAVAYKLGQLEILRLRAQARTRLGEGFDIKGFHDAVLGKGAVTLSVLAQQIENWTNSK